MSGTPHALKHGDSFAVFDEAGALTGLFHRDTRHLVVLPVTVDGQVPEATGTWPSLDNTLLLSALGHGHLTLSRARCVWRDCLYERLHLRHTGEAARHLTLDIGFAADFADLFEVRGYRRERRGESLPVVIADDHVILAYRGLDDRQRATRLSFDPPPSRLGESGARFMLELAPGASRSLFIVVSCEMQPPVAFFAALRAAKRALRHSIARAASVSSSNPSFDAAIRRNVTDLYTLVSELPEGPYPYAGIPWFSTVFGRDGLIAALQCLWLDPEIARGVLGHLAATQATAIDAAADAAPGKILHEARHGEMAALGEVPFGRYYGSVDATPLFVMLAGAYLRRTDDVASLRRLWPSIAAALDWMARHGDGDGFVTYERQSEKGLANQGWKDSPDAVFHADGSLAHGPIALVEVQAYAYGAWRAAAEIARRLGVSDPAAYDARAESLRLAFDARFFDAVLGSYVLALDGEKRPCRVLASNAGHALLTGIAYPERAASVARTLMDARSFGGWGIRSVAEGEARYDAMSYHNGSVWPHDNALIAAGFARYGLRHEAARLFEALFAAALHFGDGRLPELFGGFAREPQKGPTFHPVACLPQAWAATAPLFMLRSCLGLRFDLDAGRIRLEQPVLPAFLDAITLRNVPIGDTRASITWRRDGAG